MPPRLRLPTNLLRPKTLSPPTISILWFSSRRNSSSSSNPPMSTYKVQKSDQEWRAVLSPEQFRVLRESGTERPFSGEYDGHFAKAGVYKCAGCGAGLYKADTK